MDVKRTAARAQVLWGKINEGTATKAECDEYKRLKALIRKALNPKR